MMEDPRLLTAYRLAAKWGVGDPEEVMASLEPEDILRWSAYFEAERMDFQQTLIECLGDPEPQPVHETLEEQARKVLSRYGHDRDTSG